MIKKTAATTNLRLIAARVIDQVTAGHSLTDCLESQLSPIRAARDRSFVQALCYGVCRFYSRLDVILSYLLKKPLKAKDTDVHALLLVGLYQLMEMRVPPHAAVAETVDATENLGKTWAQGLVNAILREYLRQREQIEEKIKEDPEAFYAHPAWWIKAISLAWPDHWQEILQANNQHPPFSLRVNQLRLTREQYLDQLPAQTYSAHSIPETRSGIILETPISTDELPGFSAGDVSVQDGASQLAAPLLSLTPELRVLDACAAPGGKLMHIVETEPTLLAVIAVEKDAKRIVSIRENLTRLKVNATCICHDVSAVNVWWDGQLFDRILLDAPCSASGVIRRHPDIKLLRQPGDMKVLAKEQRHLLESLWPLLKPGGLLLYATCSIFPEENVQVVQPFLVSHADAKEDSIRAEWGVPLTVGRQILPGQHNMDGFYYVRLRKIG